MEFDGKILLDAYKDIPDYPYGEQPPFGCRHVWVGVAKGFEDKPDGENAGINGAAAKGEDTEKSLLLVGEKDEFVNKDSANNFYDSNKIQNEVYKHKETENIKKQLSKITDSEIKTHFNVKIYDYTTQNKNGEHVFFNDGRSDDIRLSVNTYNNLTKTFDKVIKKSKSPKENISLSENEIIALNTYFHEKKHGIQSASINKYNLLNSEKKLMEYLVETLARKETKDFCFKKFHQKTSVPIGNYNDVFGNITKYAKNINYNKIEDFLTNGNYNEVINILPELIGCEKKDVGLILIDNITK